MKTKIVILLLILAFADLTFQKHFLRVVNPQKTHKQSDENLKCPGQQYRSEESFNNLMEQIDSGFMTKDKIEIMKEEVPKDPAVFNFDQFLQLIQVASMTSDKVTIIHLLDKFIPYITTDQCVSILNELGFSDDKLEVLEAIATLLIDSDSDENKQKIIELFGLSDDQEKAKEILENAGVRNCIFGTVNENVATFIIDVSPSMLQTFEGSDGITYSRLEFVKKNLKETIANQLKDYQQFNVQSLYQYTQLWRSTSVSATPENIQSALDWIDALGSRGYTNLSYPIKKAFESSEQLEAIYLLTDGQPTYGIQSVDKMASYVQSYVDSRDPKVKIYCTGFMLGGSESENERAEAQDFLKTIAEVSGGSLKTFE